QRWALPRPRACSAAPPRPTRTRSYVRSARCCSLSRSAGDRLAVLSPQVFAILSSLIEEKIGLHYAPSDADLLAEKLAPRAAEAGFESLLDYYYFLRYDPAAEQELTALTDALVVGETYLFRE